jgi:hypothetical protein
MAQITPARRRTCAAVALAAALAAGCSGSRAEPAAAPVHSGVTSTPAVMSTPAAPATPSTRMPAPRPAKRVPHDFVAAAAPVSFTYRAPGYRIHAHVCGMEYVRPLDPPGEQHHTVCWVQHDFGFAPGSRARGTTYVLGHSWAEDPHEVLNKVSETAMRQVLPMIAKHRIRTVSGIVTYPVTELDGDLVTLRTPTGRLTYTVRNAFAVAKTEAGYVRPLMDEHTRNRVVIITCGELHGVDYDYNIILDAFLTSSKATTSRT